MRRRRARGPLLVASALFAACGPRDELASLAPPPTAAAPPAQEAASAEPSIADVVLEEGGCSITVAAVVGFEVKRGGYRSDEWIAKLPPEQRRMAIGEDHAEVHGRCVLAVRVDGAPRFFLEVLQGFPGPDQPSAEKCAARRKEVAEHLMIVTEHCADPSGRGALSVAPP